jgi:hypothetical protein
MHATRSQQRGIGRRFENRRSSEPIDDRPTQPKRQIFAADFLQMQQTGIIDAISDCEIGRRGRRLGGAAIAFLSLRAGPRGAAPLRRPQSGGRAAQLRSEDVDDAKRTAQFVVIGLGSRAERAARIYAARCSGAA